MMQITDAPYAAGTPEHNEWVREVFIPHQLNTETHGAHQVGSAESQGFGLIRGRWEDHHDHAFDDEGNYAPARPTDWVVACSRYEQDLWDRWRANFADQVIILDDTFKSVAGVTQDATNSFTFFI